MLALVAAVTFVRPFAPGQLEGVADHLLRALPADHLEALANVGRDHVLDPGVQVLDVLADDHQVHALAGVAGRHAGQLASRPHVGVRLEQLAQGDVGALLAEPDGGLERALEDDPGPLDRVPGLGRHAGRVALLEDARARSRLFPVDEHAGRLDHPDRRADHLRADTVPGITVTRWAADGIGGSLLAGSRISRASVVGCGHSSHGARPIPRRWPPWCRIPTTTPPSSLSARREVYHQIGSSGPGLTFDRSLEGQTIPG